MGSDNYLDQHMLSEGHQLSAEKACSFLKCIQCERNICTQLNKQYEIEQEETKAGILSIIDIIIALGQRNIPFRGNWDRVKEKEDGNFDFFVRWKSQYDKKLKQHLDSAKSNAKYLSPRIQNEIIALCEISIRRNILDEIPFYWSILVDETEDCSKMEQLSICARFVNRKCKICEEFLGFVTIPDLTAETISNCILKCVDEWGLKKFKLVGQGYDGATTMSSSKKGVQSRIIQHHPNAMYVHCRSHVLNLAIAKSCESVPSIRDLFDNVGKLTWFLTGSAKRKELYLKSNGSQNNDSLIELFTEDDNDIMSKSAAELKSGANKKTVPKFCATRWTARMSTLSALLAKYEIVLNSLEAIEAASSGESKSEAGTYVRMLGDSQFIVSLVVAQHLLTYLGPVTKILQSFECNLAEAYECVITAKECTANSRNVEVWSKIWERIQTLSETLNIMISKPRTCNRQVHRANAPSPSASDHYCINVFYAFIDHIIQQLSDRFTHEHSDMISAENLIPSNLHRKTEFPIDKIQKFYSKFFERNFDLEFEQELHRWRQHHKNDNKTKCASEALSKTSATVFPFIHKILTIFLTIPVGSVACERSFSALRRLKLWTRASMSEERLSGLAMLHVHRENASYMPSPLSIFESKTNWKNI